MILKNKYSIRVNCGSDDDYIDKSGNTWVSDQEYKDGEWGFLSGAPWHSAENIIGTDEVTLYQTSRFDSKLSYKFDNMSHGQYKVILYFAETFFEQPYQRVFNISINGREVFADFDIISEAGYLNSIVKSFNVVSTDGKLHLCLTSTQNDALLNAIEINENVEPFVESVSANITSGSQIIKSQEIEFRCMEDSAIYYTTDGTDPKVSKSKIKYNAPFFLSDDTVIKVYAKSDSIEDSDVSEFKYYIVDPIPPMENSGQSGRCKIDISGNGWKLWLDTRASWKNDKLYLPGDVYLPGMPINPPTVGWKAMYNAKGINISIPASIEEYFGKGINTYSYHGVSWFWKKVYIPSDWEGKTVQIHVEKARLRVEIYVNEQLSGYDLVCDTPFVFNISNVLKYGEDNQIAFRITNPGGSRGWEDYWRVKWGDYILPSSHDFSDIGGEVSIVATNNTYIDNVFVKNLLPVGGNNIEIITTLKNCQNKNVPLDLSINIYPAKGAAIYTQTTKVIAGKYESSLIGSSITENITQISIPEAKPWDIESPTLYTIEVCINNSLGISDQITETFGFRIFEIKEVEGKHRLYFNGKRIRHRSAIDWSYYVPGGNYSTNETAFKSVKAAKDIGHNGINFHRRIGEPLVFKYANEMGLYMYEEPGGFHIHQGEDMTTSPFAVEIMKMKIMRMVQRDRNHPSLIWYCLCNEDNDDENESRMWALKKISEMDGTRMVANSSQDDNIKLGHIKHIRPYENHIRLDFYDLHTIENKARFDDDLVFGLNNTTDDSRIWYWGESGCFTGPSNWYQVAEQQKSLADGRIIYDLNIYKPLHDKIEEYFNDNDLANAGSENIKTPYDITQQAGRGLMYANGRIGQSTMIWNSADGFAINGWSNGPMLPDEWDSALCDEARNLKGPASDYAYWVRDLQIAILRKNGKYFNVGDTAVFEVHLINEGKLQKGSYTLKVNVKDGNGEYICFNKTLPVSVNGGDIYSQKLLEELRVELDNDCKGGYVTVECKLFDSNGVEKADGCEQILLSNRPSFGKDIFDFTGAIMNWPEAEIAIIESGIEISEYKTDIESLNYVVAGDTPNDDVILDVLFRVRENGTVLIIRFNQDWANLLFQNGLLSQSVTEWGGEQTGSWKGNGWGYIDYFVGNQAIPSGSTISTNGWEVPGDPIGFYPFKSEYPTKAYGAYMARHNDFKVLIGVINYGKGKVILAPAYPVNDTNSFNDMLFYNLISKSCNNNL